MLNEINQLVCTIAEQTAESTLAIVRAEIRKLQSVKRVYNEEEAAEFLGIKKEQLQKYRIDGLINFVAFPKVSKFEPVLTGEVKKRRNGLYGYTFEALMDFAERNEVLAVPRKRKISESRG